MQRFIIDRFEEDKAVLVSSDGQSIVIPKSDLPSTVAAGEAVQPRWASVSTGNEESLAKQLLNDILSNGK
jgi:hypothetical protein